jgi:hypothetical protein
VEWSLYVAGERKEFTVQSPYDNRSAICMPAYWGKWFVWIGDGPVRQTNLNIFYQLGSNLAYLTHIAHPGQELGEFFSYSIIPRLWFSSFIGETAGLNDELKDSRGSAQSLLDKIDVLSSDARNDWKRPITQGECSSLAFHKEMLEKNFEREHRNIDAFTVLPKGIYCTRLLIEKPGNKFPEDVRSVFSDIVLYDLSQAGRCLAFETPTAVAFHVFRATEAVMKDYYEALSRQKWTDTRHEWGRYVGEIEKLPNANKDVVMRLKEIGRFERNPTIHEDVMDVIVSLHKAPILFELCTGVIYTMAVESKRQSNRTVDWCQCDRLGNFYLRAA